VFIEDKLDKTGARMTPLRCLSQPNGLSKSSAPTAKKFLKFNPLRTTVVCDLQPHDLLNNVNSNKILNFHGDMI
jgi:hypothetical protein